MTTRLVDETYKGEEVRTRSVVEHQNVVALKMRYRRRFLPECPVVHYLDKHKRIWHVLPTGNASAKCDDADYLRIMEKKRYEQHARHLQEKRDTICHSAWYNGCTPDGAPVPHVASSVQSKVHRRPRRKDPTLWRLAVSFVLPSDSANSESRLNSLSPAPSCNN